MDKSTRRKPLQTITNHRRKSDKTRKDDEVYIQKSRQKSSKTNAEGDNNKFDASNKENIRPIQIERRPLQDISIYAKGTGKRTKQLSDEEMGHHILNFYLNPLVNGKIQGIAQFLIERDIKRNENAFRRCWKNSKLKEMKMNDEPFYKAKRVLDKFFKEEKKKRNAKNARNWSSNLADNIDNEKKIEQIPVCLKGKIL